MRSPELNALELPAGQDPSGRPAFGCSTTELIWHPQ